MLMFYLADTFSSQKRDKRSAAECFLIGNYYCPSYLHTNKHIQRHPERHNTRNNHACWARSKGCVSLSFLLLLLQGCHTPVPNRKLKLFGGTITRTTIAKKISPKKAMVVGERNNTKNSQPKNFSGAVITGIFEHLFNLA